MDLFGFYLGPFGPDLEEEHLLDEMVEFHLLVRPRVLKRKVIGVGGKLKEAGWEPR